MLSGLSSTGLNTTRSFLFVDTFAGFTFAACALASFAGVEGAEAVRIDDFGL